MKGNIKSSRAEAVSLDDKYSTDKKRAFLSGSEALVRLPMIQRQRDVACGLNTAGYISGYRGSPVGGVDQAMWKARRWLDEHHVHFQAGVNEDLAATAVWGSQQTNLFAGAKYDGVFGMWYGKGPGVDRSMDAIKHANASGTSQFGGVLAVAGDDHACKSSTLAHQSEHMLIGAMVPILNPSNVQEILDLGVYGWELSRYSGCWVGLKVITENMDSAISADISADRIQIEIPEQFELPEGGVHTRWPDKPLDQEMRLQRYKIYAAREFARVNHLNRIVIDNPDARFGIITTGKAYLDVMQALQDLGIDQALAKQIGLRVYKVGMSWPLEPTVTRQFADGLEEILVVEEKRPVIEDQLTGQLYKNPVNTYPRVVGEFDESGHHLVSSLAELTPTMVAKVIAARIGQFYQSEVVEQRVQWIRQKEASLSKVSTNMARAPHFCSGCPHNTSTKVPQGSQAYAGIGCHYMAVWMPDRMTETSTHMGAEGAAWIGQVPFTETSHIFQNIGDGTYFHSGLLAIRAAVAAGVNITYKILYNDAVALTGGQPVDGLLTIDNLIMQLSGEGIKRIALVSDQPDKWRGRVGQVSGFSLHHRDEMDVLQRELREFKGCSVLVYEQTCAAEKRRRRKKGLLEDPARRVFINSEVCEGCGDCSVQSNCLSILPLETELGRKRKIDQSGCNKDYSCVKGFCPSFVTVVGGKPRKLLPATLKSSVTFDTLPSPQLPDLSRPWNTVITGIGGTGVLTIGSLVAMAAHIEGKGCTTLNQTGLAQKFGAVLCHVRVSQQQADIQAVRISTGEADLLLGCDLVVSAGIEALGKVSRQRSHAVINNAEVPTSAFILNPDAEFPAQAMQQQIEGEVGDGCSHFINAGRVATALMGDSIAANLFMLGYAWQKGLVPVGADAIQQAIELNAVAVEFNQQAFVWGRRYADQADKVLSLIASDERKPHPANLDELIVDRVARLSAYQNETYAQRYRQRIDSICSLDKRSDEPGSLSMTSAESLYRLMAYKDEYEVARLYTDGDFKARLDRQFEGDFSLRFNLAPPLFSKRDPHSQKLLKREYGPWVMKVFSLLTRLKSLRGTAFDIFGYSAERRLEREDITEFETMLDEISAGLSAENYPLAVELVALSQDLRGFGHVKENNREKLRTRRENLLQRFRGETAVELYSRSGSRAA